ncbi:hypothetical protein F8388_009715 [Cannabis sativa]|uniref:Epidermal patterning factor-like protein n=1 Tax=Cannabis sativa TaxID=3483 RepID=A0A7J6H2U8_CANSA|nr:hypothetical protein G4B88_008752 [Cannabis sativa]KAF4389582.1 hypothetical protein F8388_009715 [Cannabis sativa]
MVTPSPSPSPLMVPRYLSGIGSSPPRCLWKCGNCTPCKPVHVPVPPGTPVTAEYYPEAWRSLLMTLFVEQLSETVNTVAVELAQDKAERKASKTQKAELLLEMEKLKQEVSKAI